MISGKKLFLFVCGAIVLALMGGGLLIFQRSWRLAHDSQVERGRRLADKMGCFSCHGPAGLSGIRNPRIGEWYEEHVPPWDGRSITRNIGSEKEIHEWILDGMSIRVRDDPTALQELRSRPIRMPPYRRFFNKDELADIVAYYKAVAWFEKPTDPLIRSGLDLAGRFGCFACNGPEGRGLVQNVRSFKGYVPAWIGPDFKELVHDDRELDEWILDGYIKRFQHNPVAGYFLEAQVIKMPAYRKFLTPHQLASLKAYIHWLRKD